MRRALLALGACAALAALPPAAAQSKAETARVTALVAALGDSKNLSARNDAYLTLLREKPPAALALLLESLPGFDVQGQEYGLTLLQVYPQEQGLPLLRKLLDAKSPLLAAGAAAIFVRRGEREFVEPLVKCFERPGTPAEELRAMLNRIYAIRDARLCDAVRKLLAPGTELRVLDEALYQLQSADDAATRRRAVELLALPGLAAPARASCAAFLLGAGEDARSRELAAVVAADGGATLARLQRFLLNAPRLGEELLAAVAALAERASATVYQQTAVTLLARHATEKEAPVLERLLAAKELGLAKSALEALQKRFGTVPRETLTRMLAAQDAQRALAAADALRRADDDAGLARVLELVHAGGAERAEAVRVLAHFRRRAAVPALIEALDDPDLAVRRAAETGLVPLLASLFPYRKIELASTGYTAQADPATRSAAVARMRAWWEAHGKR